MLDWLVPHLDTMFLVGSMILNVAFLPTLIRPSNKPDRITSLVFTIVLASQATGLEAMGLHWAAGSMIFGAGLWAVTIFQQRK